MLEMTNDLSFAKNYFQKILTKCYFNTSWDFAKEIEEEKLEFLDAIYTWFKTLLS